MPDLETIADYGDLCGECPVWNAAAGYLYWTDLTGRRFYRYQPDTGAHAVVYSGFQVCGFRLNRSGGFAVTNSEGIWLWDGAGARIRLCAEVDGAPCRVNDCAADPRGRLPTGTQFYDPAGGYPLGKLIVVDTGGAVRALDEGFHLANGIAFSPDTQTLYFTDSVARRIYAYDYDPETGTAAKRRTLVQVPGGEGLPDGLTVDSEGFLWSAQWYGSRVVRYDPDGRVERRISTPAKQTTAVTFGGPELDELYITSAGQSEAMPVMPPGYDPEKGYFGGALFRTGPGVRGKAEFLANIRVGAAESGGAI